jgi:hypothetical protein
MNIKRIFGSVLTILGIGGLIFTAIAFVNSDGANNVKALVIYGILAVTFFGSGISIVRGTRDEA